MFQGIIKPLIPEGTKSPASLRQFADAMRKKDPVAANAFERAQQSFDRLDQILRATPEQADEIVISDPDGNVIGWIGSRDGYWGAWFGQIYAGGTGPIDSNLYIDNAGVLNIRDAFIQLSGTTSIITLDPTTGDLTITPNPTTGRILTLNSQKIELLDKDGLAVFRIIDNEDPPTGLPPAPTEGNVIWLDTGASTSVYALDLKASSCAGTGATLRIAGMNGTKSIPTATGVGDRLGTIVFDGYASGQAYIRATQKSASDTELTLSTTSSGFSYTRLRCDELGVEIPSNNLRVPSGYINVGGAAVSGKKLTVVGTSYLNGNVELPALTASLPLKVNASKVITAAKIDAGAAADIAATGFSAGDYAQWDGSKFVPVTLATLAASLASSFPAANVLGSGHTITLAKITPGGTDGAIQFNADGQLIAYVDPT